MDGQDLLPTILAQQQETLRLKLARRTLVRDILPEALKQFESPLIKVIIGPRRCGKSTLAIQLVEKTAFGFLDFDDPDLLRYLNSNGTTGLLKALRSIYGDFGNLVLDEVQNFKDWELLVNKLQKHGLNLIVTGSNANLLSREFATHLTGRYHEISLLPFSWNEYNAWYEGRASFDDYLRQGGFPETLFPGVEAGTYLETLANAVLLKDIVQRYRIRQPTRLIALWNSLQAQFAQYMTVSRMAKTLEFPSKTTLQKYLKYIEEAFLCCEIMRYDSKFREQLKAPRKLYVIDTGLVAGLSLPFDATSRRLENAVYLGLLRHRRGAAGIFYAQTRAGLEIDFLLRTQERTDALIQVCYNLDNPATRERELRAFVNGVVEFRCNNCILIANARPGVMQWEGLKIRVVTPQSFLENDASLLTN